MWKLLRGNRDVRWLLLAQVVSYMGDWFAYVAFVGVVHDASDRSLLVTLVVVAQALPLFLATPVAGPVADRFNRQVVICAVSLLQMVAAAALLMVHSAGTLWIGYAAICVIAALGAFVAPAVQAALPNLTRDAEELASANVLFGSMWGAMVAVGAALGGVVAGLFGRDAAFVVNAVSFLLAAAAVSMIRHPMQAPRDHHTARQRIRPIADTKEAFGYARRDPVLLAMVASKATFAVGAGIIGLLAVLVTDDLGGGDTKTGIMIGVRGAGVALGPLIAAPFARSSLPRIIQICGWSGAIFGACYLGISVSSLYVVAVVWAFAAHLASGAVWTLSTYGLLVRSPDHVRGRILAGDLAFMTLTITISSLAAGSLADVLGPRVTIALFAAIGIGAATIYLSVTAALRRRLEEEATTEALRTT